MTRLSSNKNRSFARQFNTSAAAFALAAGVAFAGPILEPEKMPETTEPTNTELTKTVVPVLMTGDELTAAGWSGWRVEGFGHGDSIAVSPDGFFWMTTLRATDAFGNEAELLVRVHEAEVEIVGSTVEPWNSLVWDDLTPIDMDDDGSGDAEGFRKYFSRDELQKIDEEQSESAILKVTPYERYDDAIRFDGTQFERMNEDDVQAITAQEPTYQWRTDEFEYLAYQDGEIQGVFRQARDVEACPADFNGDSYADNADISSFIEAFLRGSKRADLNRDGVLDAGDLERYIGQFLAGC